MGIIILKIKWHLIAVLKKIIFKLLFGSKLRIGSKTTFRKSFSIYMEKEAEIAIGDKCFFNNYCSLNALEKIVIGDGCIFGENVKIYDQNHRFADDNTDLKNQGFSTHPIYIGKHCWIGSNVTILKGAKIGDNSVIGAGCVISESIPDNSLVTMNRDIDIRTINRR